MRASVVSLVLFLISLPAVQAKSRFLLLGGTEKNCKQQYLPVRAVLVELPIPENWTFVVACTPTVWDDLLRRIDGLGKTHTAFTNLDGHYTYFNGSAFAPRVAAHELGHILGTTEDHEKAETIGLALLRQVHVPSSQRK